MKATIEVTNRKEAAHIHRALADPATRALVIVMGALLDLPSDRARLRTLAYVSDLLNETDSNG